MPPKHSRQRRAALIKKALPYIRQGHSYRDAQKRFKIPRSTIHRHLNGPISKPGRKRALTDQEELMIIDFSIRYAQKGLPLAERHLCEAISIVVGRLPPARRLILPFKHTNPSPGFLRAFRKRHADKLSFSKPLRQEAKRFSATNAEALTTHFATVRKLIIDNQIDEDRFFNLDELGATPDKDINGKTGSRRLSERNGHRDMRLPEFKYKNRVTMMAVISAGGEAAPPLFVLKGEKVPYRQVLRNGLIDTETPATFLPRRSVLTTRSEGGGVDSKNFISWALEFVEFVKDLTRGGRKVLMVYDAYRSHISMAVLKIFSENNIIIYALPSHTSGKTQPCDLVVFSCFKRALNTVSSECVPLNGEVEIGVFEFCALLKEAYVRSFTADNVKASFRRAGLWPLDPKRLLGEPRPANANPDSEILSVEELEKAFEEKRKEISAKVLGSDAKMMKCGYVDTRNGCVMTAPAVMELVRKKEEHDRRKRDLKARESTEKQIRAERRNTAARAELRRLLTAQLCRRAELCGETAEEFSKRVRSVGERRARARLMAMNKRNYE